MAEAISLFLKPKAKAMIEPQAIINKRYQLERQLGQNAGRETWLAKDFQQGHELVVVKLLAFGGKVQWEDLKLFEREATVLQQLNHPRIPKYRDYFSIDDRSLWFGLVQEYIQGESLKECLEKGQKFTESQVKQMAIALLEILQYLHELNPPVLHRDIKPSNLILTGKDGENRNIYLVDFGAVQDRASAEGKSFTIVGTYGYAPMEQYGGRAVAASDLYALGATLIHLLTGVSPADLPQDDDAKIIFRDRTSASLHLGQWIQKLVEPTVKKRYATAREALQALQEPVTPNPVILKPVTPNPVTTSSQAVTKSAVPTSQFVNSQFVSSQFVNSQFVSSRPKRRIYPPDNTSIQVEQSPTQLRILIPCKLWTAIAFWGLIIASFVFLQPFYVNLFSLIDIAKNHIGTYILILVMIGTLLFLTLNQLTTVILEIGEQETWLRRSLLGKVYWKAIFPTQELNGVAPKWSRVENRSSNMIGLLIWLSSEHSEDNSMKSNVILQLQNTEYVLSIFNLRPTEVSWLIDVIEDFLYSIK